MCSDVEDLKKDRQEVVQPHALVNSGAVHRTPVQSIMIMPVKSDGIVDDKVVSGLTWVKKMDLEDEFTEVPDNTTDERSGVTKLT